MGGSSYLSRSGNEREFPRQTLSAYMKKHNTRVHPHCASSLVSLYHPLDWGYVATSCNSIGIILSLLTGELFPPAEMTYDLRYTRIDGDKFTEEQLIIVIWITTYL